MSKPKKKTSKMLVRHPSVPLRPPKPPEKIQLKRVHFVEDTAQDSDSSNFLTPEFCTVLQVADEMKSIRNSQSVSKGLPGGVKYKNLNFLPEEKIYQDLIGLEVPEQQYLNEVKSQPSRVSLKKDPELDVNKYLQYMLEPEYYFSSQAVPVLKKQPPVYDGYLIFNKMKEWQTQMNSGRLKYA